MITFPLPVHCAAFLHATALIYVVAGWLLLRKVYTHMAPASQTLPPSGTAPLSLAPVPFPWFVTAEQMQDFMRDLTSWETKVRSAELVAGLYAECSPSKIGVLHKGRSRTRSHCPLPATWK